jgi:DNA-binding NarL/FixJ family response regulator
VLREIEGLSSEEVATVLGLSASTVRNHLFQARRTLQAELKRRYPEYVPAARVEATETTKPEPGGGHAR